MEKTIQKELNRLNQIKHSYIRQNDNGTLVGEEYERKYNNVKEQITTHVNNIIANSKVTMAEDEIKDTERKKKMETEIAETKKKNFKPRGPKKDSYASYIIEALAMKTVKDIDAVVAHVVAKKPGREDKKVRAQVVVMINEIKKGKKPKYTWDAEAFLLTDVDAPKTE